MSDRTRMLAGLAGEERRLELGGVKTSVLEFGEGSPLLLLHGGIECGGPIWAPVVSRLADDYRVVIPDVPGLGESEPVERLDPETFGRWLNALLATVFREPPVLVAHSLIGNYSARFAIGNGDGIRRLVIYAAPGIGPYRIPLGLRIAGLRYALRPTRRNAERFESFALLDRNATRARDAGWFDAFSSDCFERGRTPHVKRSMNQLLKIGTRRIGDSDLARIEPPVMMLWGRGDRMTPLAVAEEAASELGWPLGVVDDVAHVPHIERPDRFLDTLYSLLES